MSCTWAGGIKPARTVLQQRVVTLALMVIAAEGPRFAALYVTGCAALLGHLRWRFAVQRGA